jgi:hypothetical protein
VHINWLDAFFLIDEGMVAAGFKEEPGKQDALGSDCAQGSVCLDDRNEVNLWIVDAEEVIDV